MYQPHLSSENTISVSVGLNVFLTLRRNIFLRKINKNTILQHRIWTIFRIVTIRYYLSSEDPLFCFASQRHYSLHCLFILRRIFSELNTERCELYCANLYIAWAYNYALRVVLTPRTVNKCTQQKRVRFCLHSNRKREGYFSKTLSCLIRLFLLTKRHIRAIL